MQKRIFRVATVACWLAAAALPGGGGAHSQAANWHAKGTNSWKGPFITGRLPAGCSVYVWDGTSRWNYASNTPDPVGPRSVFAGGWPAVSRMPVYVMNTTNWATSPPISDSLTPEEVKRLGMPFYVLNTSNWVGRTSIPDSAGLEDARRLTERLLNDPIRKVAPEQLEAYQRAAARSAGIETTRAGLAVLAKAAEGVEGPYASEEQRGQVVTGYFNAWRLCLRLWRSAKDPAAKDLVLDRWNIALAKGGRGVVYPLRALDCEGGRGLMTEEFWALLRKSDDLRTVNAICCVLYHHGELADMKPLHEKLASGAPPSLRGQLESAIVHWKYDHSDHLWPDGSFNYGPPSGPPIWLDD